MLKNLKLTRPLCFFDLETTSADPATARIVELGACIIRPDRTYHAMRQRFNPGMPIPAEATQVHGITDADVAGEQPFAAAAHYIANVFGECDLAGFNIVRYDLRVLTEEFKRVPVQFSLDNRAVIDAMALYHKLRPRNLSACVREFLGRGHVGAHMADADVRATIECLDAMLSNEQPDDGTGLMPNTVPALVEYLKDPDTVDSGGFFTRSGDKVRMKIGKHRGQPVEWVAKHYPDYLQWVIGQTAYDDTKRIARDALDAARGPRLC